MQDEQARRLPDSRIRFPANNRCHCTNPVLNPGMPMGLAFVFQGGLRGSCPARFATGAIAGQAHGSARYLRHRSLFQRCCCAHIGVLMG